MKVLSSETIPSSVSLVDPNLRNLAAEVAIKVNNVCNVHRISAVVLHSCKWSSG